MIIFLQKSSFEGPGGSTMVPKNGLFKDPGAEFFPGPFFTFPTLFYEKKKLLDPRHLTKFIFHIKTQFSIFWSKVKFWTTHHFAPIFIFFKIVLPGGIFSEAKKNDFTHLKLRNFAKHVKLSDHKHYRSIGHDLSHLKNFEILLFCLVGAKNSYGI